MGVTADAVSSALGNAFGQSIVSTIYAPLNQYRVIMEVDPRYAQGPEALRDVYVRSKDGQLVPLAAFARYELTNVPLGVNHQGQFAAATISYGVAPGVSLSQANDLIRTTMARIGVPSNVYGSFEGTAKVFQTGLAGQPLLILAAIVTIYLVLGILYESTIHPITILSTLPSAGVGALLALMAFDTEFSLVALIAVFLLIGIVKKNAIMMVDFALETERREGRRPEEAIISACLLRFRPILMTTMAAIIGALPLAFGTGYGAELRKPLGIAIVGGLLVSQLLTLYTTPVVYLYLDRLRLWFASRRRSARRGGATAGATR
jgi:multidrug efflux pump